MSKLNEPLNFFKSLVTTYHNHKMITQYQSNILFKISNLDLSHVMLPESQGQNPGLG